MFGIGTTELIVVAMVALLLFGNRLPSVMRSLGSGVSEFKKGMDGLNRELTREVDREPTKQVYSQGSGELDRATGPQVDGGEEVVEAVGKQ
jgi:sec-independent protein translocase protein TatA